MEKNRIFAKECTVDVALKNTVDKDVQSMLLPFNLLQCIMFCPNYRIKDNVITPNSLFSVLVSIFGALVFCFTTICRAYMFLFYKEYLGDTIFMYIVVFYDCIYNCLGFAINMITGIIQTKSNIQFVLTFQDVHRFLSDQPSFKRIIIWNWIAAVWALTGYVSVLTYFVSELNLSFFKMLSCYFTVFFDFNVSYLIRVIRMLEEKVQLWNRHALDTGVQVMEGTHGKEFSNQLFQAYVDIMKCYDNQICCLQYFLLFYTLQVFLHALVYIQVSIEILQRGLVNFDSELIASMSIYIWVVKDLSWQILLSRQCEKFYIAIESVQETCALILKSKCSDDKRKLCKNLLRFHRVSFSKIRVFGLFNIDAALQLSLLSHLTNNTVVLLQFAIL